MQHSDTIIKRRAYDGKFEVVKLRYTEVLPEDIRLRHGGYPEYWTRRWVCVRVFESERKAKEFVNG